MNKGLYALSFGTLGLGIAEYVMMAILSVVAADLDISISTAGHLISAYALGVCAGAPLMVVITRGWPLRKILFLLVAVYVVGNLLAALSPGYGVLLAARFVSGLPHGGFFGVGSIVAARLSSEGKDTQAVSIMVLGMTVANTLGVPLGTFLSQNVSWRAVFLLAAAWGGITIFFIGRWIPWLAPQPDNGLRGQFRFLRTLDPWLLIAATVLGNGGIFCWYSYIDPLLTETSGFPAGSLMWLMVLAGVGMCTGNLLGGVLADRLSPQRVALRVQILAAVVLSAIFVFAGIGWVSAVLMFAGTACLFAVSSPMQVLLLRNSPGGEMMGAACVQLAFNLGNAVGAYCGGLPIESGLDCRYTALVGTGFSLAAVLVMALFYRRKKPSARVS